MTDEQGLALARLMRDRPGCRVEIMPSPFGLPADYVVVSFITDQGFVCGIAPDGRVSS